MYFRSTTLATACIMVCMGMTLQDAYALVKKHRTQTGIKDGFRADLMAYEVTVRRLSKIEDSSMYIECGDKRDKRKNKVNEENSRGGGRTSSRKGLN